MDGYFPPRIVTDGRQIPATPPLPHHHYLSKVMIGVVLVATFGRSITMINIALPPLALDRGRAAAFPLLVLSHTHSSSNSSVLPPLAVPVVVVTENKGGKIIQVAPLHKITLLDGEIGQAQRPSITTTDDEM